MLLSEGMIVVLVLIPASYWVFSQYLRRRSLDLVDASIDAQDALVLPLSERGESRLVRWLSLAGYRQRSAPAVFVASTLGALVIGASAAYGMDHWGVTAWMARSLVFIPGGAGEVLRAVALGGPAILAVVLAAAPLLVVRSARRKRVLHIEQDLPLMLDLFATLAEAGLGFDASLKRILESQSGARPLAQEFRAFQRDLLAGMPRVQCLRGLGRRMEVTSITTFVSALIQAEQIGASLAETLRHQAEDSRDRRRMKALLLAQALPVKLVSPLIVCFLPGIFVSTLGPALYQMIKVADSVLRRGR